jgi:tetratricopeptide (TPR) repeat protein
VRRELTAGIAVFEELADDARLARALCVFGKLHFWKGEIGRSVADFERSADHARRSRDEAQEALSLQGLAAAMFHGPTPASTAIDRITEISSAMATNHSLVVAAACHVGELECHRGRFDVGLPMIDEAVAMTEEHGLALLRIVSALKSKCVAELLADDAAAAENTVRTACLSAEELGERGYLSSLAPLLVDALTALRRTGDALEVNERWRPEYLTVPEDADAYINWHRSRSLVLAQTGRLVEAEVHAREALTLASRTDYLALRADCDRALGEVLRAAGRATDAAEAFRRAAAGYERKGYAVLADRVNALLVPRAQA